MHDVLASRFQFQIILQTQHPSLQQSGFV